MSNFLATLGILIILNGLSHKLIPKWETRGFIKMTPHWDNAFLLSTAVGTLVGIITTLAYPENVSLTIIMSVTAWAFSLSSYSDIMTKQAPKEIVHLSLFIVIPIMIYTIIFNEHPIRLNILSDELVTFIANENILPDLLNVAIWSLTLLLMIIFLPKDQLGMADIRLLWLAGFAFSWIIGISGMFLLLAAALLFQEAFKITKRIKYRYKKLRYIRQPLPFIPALTTSYILLGITIVTLK